MEFRGPQPHWRFPLASETRDSPDTPFPTLQTSEYTSPSSLDPFLPTLPDLTTVQDTSYIHPLHPSSLRRVSHPTASHEPLEVSPPKSQGRILWGADYLALPRAPETWLVEPLLPSGGSLLLYGDPKVGKSFAALQLAEALATGEDWLGFRCPGKPQTSSDQPNLSSLPSQPSDATAKANQVLSPPPARRVVYIQFDTPRSLWAERVANLRGAGFQTDLVAFADRETFDTWPFDVREPEHQLVLAEALHQFSADVVILDTLRECCAGADENSSTDMQVVVAGLTAAIAPAALVLVHHGKKPNLEAGRSTINDSRGSSYITGRMDAIVHFHSAGIDYTGRAVEEDELALDRVPRGQPGEGTWKLKQKEADKKLAQNLLADDTFPTLRAKSRELASRTGKTEDAALSYLNRLAKQAD
jgi:hypothetical protein